MGTTEPLLQAILRNIAVALCFCVVGQIGITLNVPGTLGSPFWPASGVALVALIVFGRGTVLGVAAGAAMLDIINFAPLSPVTLALDALGAAIEPLISLAVMRRLSPAEPFSLQSTSNTLAAWLGIAAGSAAATTLGMTGFAMGGSLPASGMIQGALTWWIGNLSGALVTAPFFLAWMREPRPALPLKRPLEAVALLGVLPAVAGFAYAGGIGAAYAAGNIVEIIAVPAVLAAIYRFGLHGMVTAAAVAALSTLVVGMSLLANTDDPRQIATALLRIQLFVTIIAGTGQLLVSEILVRARAEEDLRHALEKAEEANKAKTLFLAKMSHELRTPLNAILGFSEIIAHQTDGPPGAMLAQHRDFARDIQFSGHHLLQLINDILDISKIEADSLDLKDERLDLNIIVGECLTMVKSRAESRGLTLNADIPADLPALMADARATRQVLLNLLSNAIKFTPAGGTVGIGCARVVDGLRIMVCDTGPGMPPDVMESLFEPFHRGQPHLSQPDSEGTGLGLAICKGLVDHHQGRIEVESIPERGTCIHITFPPGRVIT